jgi:alcohol dehydrogenase class IV
MSQEIIFERGCIKTIGKMMIKQGINRPLFITGRKSFELSGAKEKIEQALGSIKIERFEVLRSLPEISEVERGIRFLKNGAFDAIIGIGGGSVLDTAKLIRFFSKQENSVAEAMKSYDLIQGRRIPLIAVPTTAGSGAEATHFAVLYADNKKFSISHQDILPNFALIDPDLSISNSSNLVAISGLDALSQGVESYWSINSTKDSRAHSKQAIELAFNSIIPAVHNKDRKSLENLSRSAFLAGQAINVSKTTAPHAVSYTLTIEYGIPHGHAVALTLGEFIKHVGGISEKDINHPLGKNFVLETLDDICKLLGAPNPITAYNNLNILISTLGLSTQLSAFGIEYPDIDHIVDNVNIERLANHPRQVTRDALKAILQSIA